MKEPCELINPSKAIVIGAAAADEAPHHAAIARVVETALNFHAGRAERMFQENEAVQNTGARFRG
jgi:hypothetical protein